MRYSIAILWLLLCICSSCTSQKKAVLEDRSLILHGKKSVKIRVKNKIALRDLAVKYNIPVEELSALNHVNKDGYVYSSQYLKLPNIRSYIVEYGDTIYSIASKYGANVDEILQINNLQDSRLYPGTVIRVPYRFTELNKKVGKVGNKSKKLVLKKGKDKLQKKGEVRASSEGKSRPKTEKSVKLDPVKKKKMEANTTGFKYSTPLNLKRFMWPLQGKVIARYGETYDGEESEGIVIAAAVGTLVKAGASGEVIYAGDRGDYYGKLVTISHPGDIVTAYGHNSKLLVKSGARVRKGQNIARVGKSGDVNVPQLHFAISKGGYTVDPDSRVNVRKK